MPATQQQLDDLLEHLIALTDAPDASGVPGVPATPDPAVQRDRLARLVLLLAERVGDPAAVHAAIDEAMRGQSEALTLAIA